MLLMTHITNQKKLNQKDLERVTNLGT